LSIEIPTDREVFTTSVRVRFYELDPYDHVNHTNYFSYFETARIEYLTVMGWGLDILKERGWQFVVVEINARFLAAARYGDEAVHALDQYLQHVPAGARFDAVLVAESPCVRRSA